MAAMTALAPPQGADSLGNPDALTSGFSAAFLGAAGIAVVGAAGWLARGGDDRGPERQRAAAGVAVGAGAPRERERRAARDANQ